MLAAPFLAALDMERVRRRGYALSWAPPEGGATHSLRDSGGDAVPPLPPNELEESDDKADDALDGPSGSDSEEEAAGGLEARRARQAAVQEEARRARQALDERFRGFSFSWQ